jgi:hypothetical protein
MLLRPHLDEHGKGAGGAGKKRRTCEIAREDDDDIAVGWGRRMGARRSQRPRRRPNGRAVRRRAARAERPPSAPRGSKSPRVPARRASTCTASASGSTHARPRPTSNPGSLPRRRGGRHRPGARRDRDRPAGRAPVRPNRPEHVPTPRSKRRRARRAPSPVAQPAGAAGVRRSRQRAPACRVAHRR